MKFFRFPIAIIAYALLGIFIFAWVYFLIGDKTPPAYWYLFPAGTVAYLLVAFILEKLKLSWELEVVIQVAFVLAPVLWYVNQREEFKRPVYIFVVNPVYTGELDINFNFNHDEPTNARSLSDTLYFKFDEDGRLTLNEEAKYVEECMQKRLYAIYPDHTRKLIRFVKKDQLPSDTTARVLVLDTAIAEKGRMKELRYRLDYPQKMK